MDYTTAVQHFNKRHLPQTQSEKIYGRLDVSPISCLATSLVVWPLGGVDVFHPSTFVPGRKPAVKTMKAS